VRPTSTRILQDHAEDYEYQAQSDWGEYHCKSQSVPGLRPIDKHGSSGGYHAPMPEQFAPEVYGYRAIPNFKVSDKPGNFALCL
jgi:hypothetical protein